ncbi:MAG: hypothetical protein FWC29_02470 [Methanomassiliicoccaceae archaeon]|nr:hypothetical protein [Methanomassiliicoccaceae archaeon]
MRVGIKKRAEGDQEGTLEMFKKAPLYLNEKRAEVISLEIETIRSQLDRLGHSTGRPTAQPEAVADGLCIHYVFV